MLLEIRYKNFYSFKNLVSISMLSEALAEHKSSLLSYSKKISAKKALSLKLFYGCQGSGKQRLLDGIKLLQKLLNHQLNINLLNTDNISYNKDKPISLGITVSVNNKVYDYDISFINNCYISEIFKVDSVTLFERNSTTIKINRSNKALSYLDDTSNRNLSVNEKQFNSQHIYMENKLFLTNIFSIFIAPKISNNFLNYVINKIIFYTNYHVDFNKIKSLVTEHNSQVIYTSAMDELTNNMQLAFEQCMKHGYCMVLGGENINYDPLKIIETIKQLHNPKINHNGQVLLSTYQYLYLNRNIIRRDEVEFVYKTNGISKTINLSHLAAREENYMKKYLAGEYIKLNSDC